MVRCRYKAVFPVFSKQSIYKFEWNNLYGFKFLYFSIFLIPISHQFIVTRANLESNFIVNCSKVLSS